MVMGNEIYPSILKDVRKCTRGERITNHYVWSELNIFCIIVEDRRSKTKKLNERTEWLANETLSKHVIRYKARERNMEDGRWIWYSHVRNPREQEDEEEVARGGGEGRRRGWEDVEELASRVY